MQRRNALTALTSLLASTLATSDVVATTERKPVSPDARQVCIDLLRLANKIGKAQLSRTDRDWLQEALASMAGKVQDKYNVPALCDTDTDCERKLGK